MTWTIKFHDDFAEEFKDFHQDVQDTLLEKLDILEKYGPRADRPLVDTLKNSKHNNMKELRFKANNGVWRVAFAFDPKRMGILLIAGDKTGVSETKFYKGLIEKADKRFDNHLRNLKKGS